MAGRIEEGNDLGAWAPYRPDDKAPWNLRRVVHLHRRAGFAATWEEIQRDLKDGPEKSVERLLAGTARSQGVPADFGRTSDRLGETAVASGDPGRLKAWWVYRMLFGPDPLTERLTLMWHDHFATSNFKVQDLPAMRGQNELLRRLGRGKFGALLKAMVRDPALLVYLDAPANRKEHPNENLARELMELFTLGVGNYSEQDVKESARCLTGWSVGDGAFREVPAHHDGGEKTVLGRTGKWGTPELVEVLLDRPATAGRLAFRLCKLLMGEETASPSRIRTLAAGIRAHDLDVGWAVGTILRSEAFFAKANLGTRVLDPAVFVVGAVQALELFEGAPSTLALADWVARLGMDLFFPPNVFGWPGGRAWITARSAVARGNFAAALAGGEMGSGSHPFDPLALARRHRRGDTLADAATFYAELLLGGVPDTGWHRRILAKVPRGGPTRAAFGRLVAAVLGSAEAQLG
jgi:hypothetical protein